MRAEDGLGVEDIPTACVRLYIPHADCLVIRCGEEIPGLLRVPAQTVAFFGVATQTQLRVARTLWLRNRWMLGVIEDEYLHEVRQLVISTIEILILFKPSVIFLKIIIKIISEVLL